jgi:membrane protease YdiL (CAAX protease family)
VALGSLLYLAYTGGEYALAVRVLGENIPRDVAAGVAVGTFAVLVSQLVAPRFQVGRRMLFAFRRVIGTPSVLTCVTMAIFSAVGEELLFRAVLQERLGLPIATALFAVAHFPVERDLWLWPLVTLPVGLAFGGLYEWSGAALAPIVAHAVINALNLRWIARLPYQD